MRVWEKKVETINALSEEYFCMEIQFIAHSCFILHGSKTIAIDPMPLGDKIDADIVLVTHAHGDHMGDHPEKFKKCYAIHELACWLQNKGVNAVGMNIGGSVTDGSVKITMVPALHSSSLTENGTIIYMGEPCGFIIEIDGLTIYHAGDTGLFSDMKLIRERYHPDIAMIPTGGTYTMGPEDAMIAAEYIGAPLVIPMHYNTFPLIKQDLTEFKRAIELTTNMKVELPSPGSSLII